MSGELKGRVAIVTGAARGIGLSVVQDLAREGVNVCGTDLRAELLAGEMGQVAADFGVETMNVPADVGVESQVANMVSLVYSNWGKVDILINNAGIRRIGPVYETLPADWDAIHSANLRGQFLCTREVLNQGMLAQNEGVIIFISSGSGLKGEKGSSAYCASKFGVTGFAESVAKDLKHTKIRTSTIMPGMVWTPMAEESEMAEADVEWLSAGQVSKAILFCIRQDSNTIIPELRIYHRAQI
ncbi:MAG: SDR family oxidoreductase [Proteobacteria bacterium]|nr:SDR family oxidoreductase [Pseudomonadota bacterium]